jgi:DNA-binding response OmpR family regulator
LLVQGNPVPVLVLTARDTTEDRIAGLDAGADDCVGKPFDLGEVVLRCRALMRHAQNPAREKLMWRDLTVNPAAMNLKSDALLQLTSREFNVPVHLVVHVGEPQRPGTENRCEVHFATSRARSHRRVREDLVPKFR